MTAPLDLARIREKLSGARGPKYWRSLEEIAEAPEFQDFLRHEFPENADQWEDGFSRRRFLQLMSASLALAGLSACTKQPDEKIVPYNEQPEAVVPGKPLFFATCLPWRGYARGAVVESHEGRPTKVEGNPRHPANPNGGTDAFMQAAVLSLYDPERAQVVTRAGTVSSWESFSAAISPVLESERTSGGAGLRVLTGTVTSPTLAAQLQSLRELYPNARWHSWDPVLRDTERAGTRLAFGRDLDFHYRFDRADVVLSLDGDFLTGGPASLRYIRDFASRRRVRAADPRLSRVYAIESTPSLVGAAADHRFPLRSSDIEQVPRAIAGGIGLPVSGSEPGTLPAAALNWITAARKDLESHRGSSVVVAGEGQTASCHAAAHLLNHALGNSGRTVVYTERVDAATGPQLDSLRELVEEMRAGKVMLLVVLGANPVYSAPADLDFRGALAKVGTSVKLGLSEDETSEWCHWNLPMTHPLECWSDSRAFDGTATIQQPLIAPLYQGRSEHELLAVLLGQDGRSGHDIVKERWRREKPGADFDGFWTRSLQDGFVAGTALPEVPVAPVLGSIPPLSAKPPERDTVEVVFRPDPTVWDGELANNGWLQELPKPLTRLTWDNAALMSPETAAGLRLAEGDVVELSIGGRKVEASCLPTPGHSDASVTVHLGYGRTRVGAVGRQTGFDAYALRTSPAMSFQTGLSLRRTGARWPLATTQHHSSMEGRNLVRTATLPAFRKNPAFAREMEEDPAKDFSLYPPVPADLPSREYAWGMSIDLNTCVGCGACVAACQAENNSPIVGKDQVVRGREMHWLRIDRYYQGDPANPATLFEPVLCMHCENAPCEVVCPVGATVHSAEGLNEMVYNRCVGTRYCSNNCPYKVRRFNFLQYSDTTSASLKLLRNPNVTVRSRGVMEKCSYCVQRISAGRIEAEKRNTPIRDGEVRTACQQACPAQAIVFGNISDPASEVARLKAEPLNYGLLTSLNTRPRTTYLARVWNPNPEIGEERG